MKELTVEIINATGLHARPASTFVNLAKQFRSKIHIHTDKKKANAKSVISVLTLGAKQGQTLRITADGDDESEALEALREAVAAGLGDELLAEAEKPAAETAPPAAGSTGIPGSPGIAIGPIYRFERVTLAIPETAGDPDTERAALDRAITAATDALKRLQQDVSARLGESEAAIFAAHQEILADAELRETADTHIRSGHSAAWAWQKTIETAAAELSAVKNDLLAARAADIRDAGGRVLAELLGQPTSVALPDNPVILVADDLSPSDTATLDRRKILGLVTAVGGANAHTAILARALGLPAVVGCGESVLSIPNGTFAILDGGAGSLTLSPDEAAIEQAKKAQEKANAARAESLRTAHEPARTTDGTLLHIMANIGGVTDAEQAAATGADGVGLLRTEFLFLERQSPPTEDEQFEVYRAIAAALGDKPVIVRTLDIGGDKPLPYLSVPDEQNPFLGQRGIRLCLARPDILRTQLRAILRASVHGNLKIMFPMITTLSDFSAARAMVDEIRAELDVKPVEIGMMVEVPAAAVMADVFARHVDFFSIGTNDLTQYTLAMDRTNQAVAGQADGLHPAVLRLIETTVRAAHAHGKMVGVCGELAADPHAGPILVGLGVDELSVSVPAVPTVKATVREMSMDKARQRAQQAVQQPSADAVRKLQG